MTSGKTIAVTIQTFVGKVITLLFNRLSTFVIAILPRNKHLLILYIHIYIYIAICMYSNMDNYIYIAQEALISDL